MHPVLPGHWLCPSPFPYPGAPSTPALPHSPVPHTLSPSLAPILVPPPKYRHPRPLFQCPHPDPTPDPQSDAPGP